MNHIFSASLLLTGLLLLPLASHGAGLTDDTDAADVLAARLQECARDADTAEVRYQDGVRSTRAWVALEATAPQRPWKDGGVYLLTGGTGTLASAFAVSLAADACGCSASASGACWLAAWASAEAWACSAGCSGCTAVVSSTASAAGVSCGSAA